MNHESKLSRESNMDYYSKRGIIISINFIYKCVRELKQSIFALQSLQHTMRR